MQVIFNYSTIIFIVLLVILKQVSLYGVLWIFMILHEIGHLITIKSLGLKIAQIYIMPLGFNLKLQEEPQSFSKRLCVETAGIIVNLIVVLIAFILKNRLIVMINLVIIILNLIPIYPLDGGRIVNTILRNRLKGIKLEEVTNKISNVTLIIITALTSILILKYHNFALIISLAYLWYIVIKENRKLKLKKRVYNILLQNNKY